MKLASSTSIVVLVFMIKCYKAFIIENIKRPPNVYHRVVITSTKSLSDLERSSSFILKMTNNEDDNDWSSSSSSTSSQRGLKGLYTRPSRAIEKGGGFFIPGLPNERIRYVSAISLLILFFINHGFGSVASTSSVSSTISELIGIFASALLFLDGLISQGIVKDFGSTFLSSSLSSSSSSQPTSASLNVIQSNLGSISETMNTMSGTQTSSTRRTRRQRPLTEKISTIARYVSKTVPTARYVACMRFNVHAGSNGSASSSSTGDSTSSGSGSVTSEDVLLELGPEVRSASLWQSRNFVIAITNSYAAAFSLSTLEPAEAESRSTVASDTNWSAAAEYAVVRGETIQECIPAYLHDSTFYTFAHESLLWVVAVDTTAGVGASTSVSAPVGASARTVRAVESVVQLNRIY